MAQQLKKSRGQCKSFTTRSGIVVGKGIGGDLIVEKERKIERKEGEKEEKEKKKKKGTRRKEKESVPVLDLPYPHAPSRKNIEGQFIRFCEILKQLELIFLSLKVWNRCLLMPNL